MAEITAPPKKRRSPAEKARDERIARVERQARQLHPGDDVEVVYSWWGIELFVDVYDNKKHVQRYVDVVDDLTAAMSAPSAR